MSYDFNNIIEVTQWSSLFHLMVVLMIIALGLNSQHMFLSLYKSQGGSESPILDQRIMMFSSFVTTSKENSV